MISCTTMRMRRKIFFSFLLVIAIPTLAFCFILLEICGRLIEERTLNASVVVIQESVKRVENRLDDYHSMTMQIYFNSELMDSLALSGENDSEKERVVYFSREILKSFVNSDRHLSTASIRTNDFSITEGTNIIDLENLIDSYRNEIMRYPGRLVWIPTTPLSSVFGLDSKYFGAVRLLRKEGKALGTLTLLVRDEFFNDSEAGELPLKGSHDYIITTGGRLLHSSGEDEPGTYIQEPFIDQVTADRRGCFISGDGKNYIIYQRSELTDWVFIRLLEKEAVLRHFNSLKESLLILIGLYILFLIILSFFLSNGLAKPLSMLARQIDFLGEGNLSFTPLGFGKHDYEIDHLNNSINAMTGRINNLIEKVTEEEQLKAKAELKALRSQLSPHFVYNTLNTVRWMAAVNRQSNIEETVMALITLMRSASDMERTIIPLEEELNILAQYVLIQKRRYREFRLETDISTDALSAGINKFIIQPFVENSLIHGFKDMEDEGIIRVKIRKEDEDRAMLKIVIRDNGCGFDPLTMNEEDEAENDSETHTGIRNIRKRLLLNYGTQHRLEVESSPGEGTTVTLSIPWITEGVGRGV